MNDGQSLHQELLRAIDNSVTIDVETTGLDPAEDRIIELAATRVEHGAVVDTFHSLINPGRDLSPFITDLTGISNALVTGAPTFAEIAPELLNFLNQADRDAHGVADVLVGHNVKFDYEFLQNELLRAAITSDTDYMPYTPKLLCTAEAARKLIPRERVGRYRLDKLAELLKTPHKPRHRAQQDVKATMDLVVALSHIEP